MSTTRWLEMKNHSMYGRLIKMEAEIGKKHNIGKGKHKPTLQWWKLFCPHPSC